jgi:hypothetical protein
MTPEELRRHEANRWLARARKHLKAARILAAAEPAASLISQPAAEKAAKGFLTFHNVPFRKVQDLKELGDQCSALDPSHSPLTGEAFDLTFAVVFRYLGRPGNQMKCRQREHWTSPTAARPGSCTSCPRRSLELRDHREESFSKSDKCTALCLAMRSIAEVEQFRVLP